MSKRTLFLLTLLALALLLLFCTFFCAPKILESRNGTTNNVAQVNCPVGAPCDAEAKTEAVNITKPTGLEALAQVTPPQPTGGVIQESKMVESTPVSSVEATTPTQTVDSAREKAQALINEAEQKEASKPTEAQQAISAEAPSSAPHTFKSIGFGYNASTLSEEEEQFVDKMITLMKEDSLVKVKLTGHTDAKGTKAYNKRLGMARAKAVKAYMVALGIDASRLVCESMGEEAPIASNKTEAGRAENRRVAFSIL